MFQYFIVHKGRVHCWMGRDKGPSAEKWAKAWGNEPIILVDTATNKPRVLEFSTTDGRYHRTREFIPLPA